MNAKRMLVWVWLLLAPALGGSLGYGFLGFQGAWQGGGGGFGTFQGVAPGLPAQGLGGESGGFLLDLGVRGFWFFREEGGWAFGVGAGYALPLGSSRGGWYVRLAFGGGRP